MHPNPAFRKASHESALAFAKQRGFGILSINGEDGPIAAHVPLTISPDWYGTDGLVPTWNYLAVHIRGQLQLLPQDDILGVIERLPDEFESRLAPKPIWKTDKVPAEALAKMMRMIVPIRLDITSIDSTRKLGQNKPDSARAGAADGLETSNIGSERSTLAQMMREALDYPRTQPIEARP